ncbi:MAG: glycosyltransferase family 9 protein [Candidatus Hinthialibacter antarcticus]|nr:glycosyltransferase family 9 protein [Candidatus Hinthialibacter antarcticus]
MFCDGCPQYDPVQSRILVIKLGATGDVLRTTALIKTLQSLYPASHLTWVCGAGSLPFINNNPNIDRALLFNDASLLFLQALSFDVCINFDLSPEACALAESVSAPTKHGYGLAPSGAVKPFSPAAETVYEMSLWDDVKRANQKTYQQLMADLITEQASYGPIQLHLPEASLAAADAFAKCAQFDANKISIGLNVGAGERWQHKKWPAEGFIELARNAHQKLNAQIIILYGPDDEAQAQKVMQSLKVPFIDAGLWPSILDFCAVLNLCDAVVTGDTFALHAALALRKKVVCLVGPTSATELELYGQGVILQGDVDCLGCYLTRCDKEPHCMNRLPADAVFNALSALLKQV